MNTRLSLSLGLSLALAAAACQTAPEARHVPSEVEDLVAHAQYERAVQVAEREARAHPDDVEVQDAYKMASAAYLLEQARRACFAKDYETALAKVHDAELIAPGDPTLAQWNEKLLDQLALRHFTTGTDWYAEYNLEAARDEFEKVLLYRPDDARAKEALATLLLQINYRRGMGEKYYDQGVALFREYWLEQSRSRFAYSGKYQPDNSRARQREKEVKSQLADSRVVLAHELERQGLFAGACNEYRIALLFDDQHAEAKEGLARTKNEAEAESLLRKAEMLTFRQRYQEASEAIEKGRGLTELQKVNFEGAAAGVEEARLESQYERARALESDLRYDEAVVVYDALLKQRTFYKDAIARKETLEGYIKKAAGLYEQAMAAPSPEEKVRLFRQIEIVWPEYRNVRELLKVLEPGTPPPTPEPNAEPTKPPSK